MGEPPESEAPKTPEEAAQTVPGNDPESDVKPDEEISVPKFLFSMNSLPPGEGEESDENSK
jgi:hypothetical protein